jgi:hypothetical protein
LLKLSPTEEATIAGSHHPPAVEVGAGDVVWCKELSGKDTATASADYVSASGLSGGTHCWRVADNLGDMP